MVTCEAGEAGEEEPTHHVPGEVVQRAVVGGTWRGGVWGKVGEARTTRINTQVKQVSWMTTP